MPKAGSGLPENSQCSHGLSWPGSLSFSPPDGTVPDTGLTWPPPCPWSPAPSPRCPTEKSTHRKLFQGLGEQHVTEHRPAVLSHLGLLAGPTGSRSGEGSGAPPSPWPSSRAPDHQEHKRWGRQGHRQEGLGLEEIVWRAGVEAWIVGRGQHGRKVGTE